MKNLVITSLTVAMSVLAFAVMASAQAPDTLWSRTYAPHSAAHSLYELPDGGFVLGGYVVPEGDTHRDLYMIRTDSLGDTLWTREIGASGHAENGGYLRPTRDGGFVIAGTAAPISPPGSPSKIYLVKTDQDGYGEWGSLVGRDTGGVSGIGAAQTLDGGYVATGVFWNSSTVYDIWMAKTDTLGVQQIPYHLAWPDSDQPTHMNVTADGGFVVTGYTQSFDTQYDYDMLILKLDQAGAELWSNAIGSAHPFDEYAYHICQTSDGGYLLSGFRHDVSWPKDVYVVKTNAGGGVQWSTQLGDSYHDVGWSGIETVDGGYAVAASWHRHGNWQVGLIKFDSLGDTTWTAFWGDSLHGHTPYGLVQTADNGYAVGGLMSGDTMSAFLVKFAPEPGFTSHTFHDGGIELPFDDTSPAVDTILIDDPGLAGLHVMGVRVYLDTLEHPAVDEVMAVLSHDGVEVTLVAPHDAAGVDFTGTGFVDGAVAAIGFAQAPYTGRFRPREQLGGFRGMDPTGEWVLMLSDSVSGNSGTLKAWHIELVTDISTDVHEPADDMPIPGYALSQCYPNPFNPTTTIRYSLPEKSDVTIEVFNALGQKVVTLVDDVKPAGSYQTTWDGCNAEGEMVAAGVYFYRLQTDSFTETKKMVLVK
ncbi:T9SS type A sorting domain-containing protein [bacterium]|nr:T9SS type A sorting domain-containing protein [bacterium]